MPSSCSHWWHAPVYIAATVALVVAAISASSSSRSPPANNPSQPFPTTSGDPAASLRLSGYHLTAAILQLSPSAVLPNTGPATFFAPPDAALSNLSLSSAAALLRRHSLPLLLPLASLRLLPSGSCLSKELALSIGPNRSISVNGVPISQPDLYLSGLLAVHGAAGEFPSADCGGARATIPWARVARELGARGYVAFAVGLGAVLGMITPSSRALEQVTIFAPQDIGFDHVAAPVAVLEGAIRRHVAIGRYGYGDLAAMEVGEEIMTLAENELLRVTASGATGAVAIEGVEITEPEAFASKRVVVHGIAQAFPMEPMVT